MILTQFKTQCAKKKLNNKIHIRKKLKPQEFAHSRRRSAEISGAWLFSKHIFEQKLIFHVWHNLNAQLLNVARIFSINSLIEVLSQNHIIFTELFFFSTSHFANWPNSIGSIILSANLRSHCVSVNTEGLYNLLQNITHCIVERVIVVIAEFLWINIFWGYFHDT